MKAYKDPTGAIRIFRPDMNMKRMNTSASRIALPVRRLPSSLAPSLTTVYRRSTAKRSSSSSRISSGSTSTGYPRNPGTVCYIRPSLSTHLLSLYLAPHLTPRSRHAKSDRRRPAQRGATLRHPQPRGAVLSRRLQARRALRHHRIRARLARRYAPPLPTPPHTNKPYPHSQAPAPTSSA